MKEYLEEPQRTGEFEATAWRIEWGFHPATWFCQTTYGRRQNPEFRRRSDWLLNTQRRARRRSMKPLGRGRTSSIEYLWATVGKPKSCMTFAICLRCRIAADNHNLFQESSKRDCFQSLSLCFFKCPLGISYFRRHVFFRPFLFLALWI